MLELSQRREYRYASAPRETEMSQQPPKKESTAVIILAAGRGARMGGDAGPKQYRMIGNKSVLLRSIEAFAFLPFVDHVLVVIHEDDEDLYNASVTPNSKLLSPAIGGLTRQLSGFNGLRALAELAPTRVLIHDAARPFVDANTIKRVCKAVTPGTCTLPGLAVADTLKRTVAHGPGSFSTTDTLEISETVSRDHLFVAQTPQGFVYSEILAAHARAAQNRNTEFTDDAAIGEADGMSVIMVEGNRENIKITTPQDLEYANRMNVMADSVMVPDIRVGNGYDVHRLVPGDGVMLGGIVIPAPFRLDGHSDADVVLHALTDALLGSVGDGDIGSHFPPSDNRWKGASSDRFLAHAAERVVEAGGAISNLDVTVICEKPKVGPHRDAMRQNIARICGIAPQRVSVKATTHETIGSLGRGEGIAALATATTVMS